MLVRQEGMCSRYLLTRSARYKMPGSTNQYILHARVLLLCRFCCHIFIITAGNRVGKLLQTLSDEARGNQGSQREKRSVCFSSVGGELCAAGLSVLLC